MKFSTGKHQKKHLVMLLHYMMVTLMFILLMMVTIMTHQAMMNFYGYVVTILILFINFHKLNDSKLTQTQLIQYQLMKYDYRTIRSLKLLNFFLYFISEHLHVKMVHILIGKIFLWPYQTWIHYLLK